METLIRWEVVPSPTLVHNIATFECQRLDSNSKRRTKPVDWGLQAFWQMASTSTSSTLRHPQLSAWRDVKLGWAGSKTLTRPASSACGIVRGRSMSISAFAIRLGYSLVLNHQKWVHPEPLPPCTAEAGQFISYKEQLYRCIVIVMVYIQYSFWLVGRPECYNCSNCSPSLARTQPKREVASVGCTTYSSCVHAWLAEPPVTP